MASMAPEEDQGGMRPPSQREGPLDGVKGEQTGPEGQQVELDPTIELEHAIGFSAVPASLHYHPNGRDYVYASGACLVICDFTDPHNQTFLRAHDDLISVLVMSSSGRLLASGQYGNNSDVLVWDFAERRLLYRLSEHDVGIKSVSFSHDERLLCSIGDDNKCFIWDMETGYVVVSAPQHPTPTDHVAFGGMVKDIKRRPTRNYLLAAAGNRSIVAFSVDPYAGEMTAIRLNCGSMVREYTCLAFSTDNEYLFAGSTSGDFAVFSMRQRKLVTSVAACACGVGSIVSFGDGLLVGGGDGTVTRFDNEMRDVAQHQIEGSVVCLSLSEDRVEVLAGTSAGFVHRMRVDQLHECLLLSENHSGAVTAVAYAEGVSDRFATISSDGSIRVWDASDYSVTTKALVKFAGEPSSLAYSLDALFSGWADGQIRAHNSETGELLWTIADAHRGGVAALALSHNNRFLVSGGADLGSAVRIWELRSRALVSHLAEHTMRVTGLALFSATAGSAYVLSVSRDRSMLTWDLRTERRIASHSVRMGGINAVVLSRDECQVLVGGTDKRVTFFDLREQLPIHTIVDAHDAEIMSIAMSHSGLVFATGGADQVVKLWEYSSCRLLASGVGHSGRVNSLKFSPDDRQLISSSEDGSIMIWNVYS